MQDRPPGRRARGGLPGFVAANLAVWAVVVVVAAVFAAAIARYAATP